MVPVNQRAHEGVWQFSHRPQPFTDEAGAESGVIVEKEQVRGALGLGEPRCRIAVGCKAHVLTADVAHERERVYFSGRWVGRSIVGKDDAEALAFLLGKHPQAIDRVGPITKHGHDHMKTNLRRLG